MWCLGRAWVPWVGSTHRAPEDVCLKPLWAAQGRLQGQGQNQGDWATTALSWEWGWMQILCKGFLVVLITTFCFCVLVMCLALLLSQLENFKSSCLSELWKRKCRHLCFVLCVSFPAAPISPAAPTPWWASHSSLSQPCPNCLFIVPAT